MKNETPFKALVPLAGVRLKIEPIINRHENR